MALDHAEYDREGQCLCHMMAEQRQALDDEWIGIGGLFVLRSMKGGIK